MNSFIVRLPKHQSTGAKRRLRGKHESGSSKKPRTSNISGRSSVQMYLDVGQRGFGRTIVCRDCGMMYVSDDLDDQRRHAVHCREKRKGISLPTLKGHKLVAEFEDCSDAIIRAPTQQSIHQPQINALLRVACDALGSSLDFIKSEDTVLLFATSKLLVGCAVFEQIDASRAVCVDNAEVCAQVMVPTAAVPNTSTREKAVSDDVSIIGVKIIWVADSQRRRGIARKLMDAARSCLTFGRIIPKQDIAFSQPTADGYAFAESYCGKQYVRAYA